MRTHDRLFAIVVHAGVHVRDGAQTEGFTGVHTPGLPQGAATWDGEPCQ